MMTTEELIRMVEAAHPAPSKCKHCGKVVMAGGQFTFDRDNLLADGLCDDCAKMSLSEREA